MTLLRKYNDSMILARELVYKADGHNAELRQALLSEQHGYCAYTEKYVESLDTVAVEHFDPSLKGTDEDGYRNYYAVLQSWNQRKAPSGVEVQRCGVSQVTLFSATGCE